MKRVNALRSTLLLTSVSSLVLGGCALKNPPFGADIMPESARAKIPGHWAGPHRSGAVVPNWILSFHDPELTALVTDAVERNPDLKAAAAREADYEFARQSLAAAVARAYFTTIEAAQQEANAEETLDIYQEYSKLTDIQKQHGFASDFDVSQIKSRTASAEDALYTAQSVRAQTIRAIEVVTSRYPAGKFDVRRSFPGQPRAVPAGLPAQILERRPDLIASERRFAAAFHRVNEARAARLPRFVLSAGSGLGTADLDSVGSLNALVWTFAGGITQPIFFGGELKAAQDLRTAEQKAAAASYVGSALRAFEDVEDALASDYYLRKREGALGDAVSSSADSVKFGRQQLEQGQIDMFTILRLTGENLAAKVQLTQIRASRLRERVNLYLALGGDFQGTGAPK